MKKFIQAFLFIMLLSCNGDFLEVQPQGVLSDVLLAQSIEGIDAVLIGAYAMLDGNDGTTGSQWYSAASNWLFAETPSDDAYLGSAPGTSLAHTIETYQYSVSEPHYYEKWRAMYEGISRCNAVLNLIAISDLPASDLAVMKAEAQFLRGHYYFDLKKIWDKMPQVDETTTDIYKGNTGEDALSWEFIENDFKAGVANLPWIPNEKGRATKGAALTYLAKAHLFQQKYAEAKMALDEVIESGLYQLAPNFHENFLLAFDNHAEAIFQVQFSVNDGADNNQNGNWGNILNYPHNISCCGFNQPSQNLVNAFKTENGLPMLYSFNEMDVTNDDGIESAASFTPYSEPLDPRLDWTVGRRGIPYWDWGVHPGKDWIRNQEWGGPYSPKKHAYQLEDVPPNSTSWTNNVHGKNWPLLRYADVLLMRAEVAVEENDLNTALELVNQVRRRAKESEPVRLDDGAPAANYAIEEYPFFADQSQARNAVRFERRLELALEGHRFFDLVRWGLAAQVLNEYVAQEKLKRYSLINAHFTENRNEYSPISWIVLKENKNIVQNPGY